MERALTRHAVPSQEFRRELVGHALDPESRQRVGSLCVVGDLSRVQVTGLVQPDDGLALAAEPFRDGVPLLLPVLSRNYLIIK